jgi:zinc protease
MQQQLWNLPTMKALRLALAALVVTFMQAVAAHAVDIKEITSPGGIKAWIVSDSTIPIIAMNFSFRGGTANDPADKVGRAYFLSGMLDEGAGDLPSEAFQERMSELAVRMSFDAEREYFEGSFQTLSENRDAAFELLRKAVAEPRFDTVPMNKVRGQILVGIKSDSENPSRIASEALLKTMLASHPYANDRKGTVDTVNAMTPDDLRDAWKATFARDRLLVGIVGDISEEEAGKMLDKVFGGLPESAGPVSMPDVQWPERGSITIVERDIPQSVMTFAMPGILRSDPDFIAAYVMNFVLGDGGFGSRLMEEIREKRGLTYGIYTGLVTWDNGGLVIGSVSTQNSRAGETLDVLRAELTKMATDGPTQGELDEAKTYITGSYPLRYDSSGKIAQQLLAIQQENLGIDYVNKRNDLVNAVTLEDAKRVAKRLIQPDALTISIVGRPEGIPLKTGETPG